MYVRNEPYPIKPSEPKTPKAILCFTLKLNEMILLPFLLNSSVKFTFNKYPAALAPSLSSEFIAKFLMVHKKQSSKEMKDRNMYLVFSCFSSSPKHPFLFSLILNPDEQHREISLLLLHGSPTLGTVFTSDFISML